MQSFRNFVIAKTVFLMFISCGIAFAAQPLLDQPDVMNGFLRSGEVLEYNAQVRGIHAGTQIMRVNGKKNFDGYEVYHVESIARTRKLFSTFYQFDNQSESFIFRKGFYPLHYRKKITDGGYKGSLVVDFDQFNQVARIVKDQERSELQIPDGIQDELSMFYLLRTKEMEVGKKYEFPALIGARSLTAGVSVLRTETLKTALGSLNTIVVKTIPGDITIWLTDDVARIPVKIEASTKVGKLVFDLKSLR